MKKLMYLIVLVLIVLSYPVSPMAKVDNMERTDNYLHVYSKDGHSKITVNMNKDLISMDLRGVYAAGCETGYTTEIHLKFDSNKSFRVPFYCSESKTNLVHSFEPYSVEKLVYNLKKYYILRVFVPGSFGVVTFDLIGFTYLYDTNF